MDNLPVVSGNRLPMSFERNVYGQLLGGLDTKVMNEIMGILSAIFGPIDPDKIVFTTMEDFLGIEPPKPKKTVFPPDVKFSYYGNTSRITDHGGVVTIASCIDTDNRVVFYGLSFCSPKDKYNKMTGKEIAYTDLMENMFSVAYTTKKHYAVNSAILADIYARKGYPSWAKNIIVYELSNAIRKVIFKDID